jgi:GNAT superfamily N-acetyltransferase
MEIIVREINKTDPEELALVTRNCMAAVLETIPEFEGRMDLAQNKLPNFSYPEMADMIRNDFTDPRKRLRVAIQDSTIVGQSLYSVKQDATGLSYGFCFSRYVEPNHRRTGVATVLIQDALEWFTQHEVAYIVATLMSRILLSRISL